MAAVTIPALLDRGAVADCGAVTGFVSSWLLSDIDRCGAW
jgi:hypothetical protein